MTATSTALRPASRRCGRTPSGAGSSGAAGFDAVRKRYGIPQMLAQVMDVYQRLRA